MGITWSVNQMDRHVRHEDNDDVVYNLHWDCVAEQDDMTHRIYGSQSLDLEDLNDFTSYSDLTEEQVMGWLMTALDVEELETKCQAGLDNKLTPVTAKGLPWVVVDDVEEMAVDGEEEG